MGFFFGGNFTIMIPLAVLHPCKSQSRIFGSRVVLFPNVSFSFGAVRLLLSVGELRGDRKSAKSDGKKKDKAKGNGEWSRTTNFIECF